MNRPTHRSASPGLVALLLSLVLVACHPDAPPPTAPPPARTPPPEPAPLVLSWSGYGPVAFGSTLADVEHLVGAQVQPAQAPDPACGYVRFASLPGIEFMVEKGIVTRADAGAGVRNVLDIAVDMPFSMVQRAHPTARIVPHKYEPDAHYLVFPTPDGGKALVLEEKHGQIVAVRAGLVPSVEYVERCS